MLRLILPLSLALAAPAGAQDAAQTALAKSVLSRLQPVSFRERREYCGYLGITRSGKLIASVAVPGDMASCSVAFPDDVAVVASYHTHGTFDDGYFNEMPSTLDMESDAESFLDGYVATPGGRLWHIDGRAGTARQICGIGCLPVAPGFRKGADGEVAEVYTYDDLRQLQN